MQPNELAVPEPGCMPRVMVEESGGLEAIAVVDRSVPLLSVVTCVVYAPYILFNGQ
jgi:hypothetical protein